MVFKFQESRRGPITKVQISPEINNPTNTLVACENWAQKYMHGSFGKLRVLDGSFGSALKGARSMENNAKNQRGWL